MAKPTIKNNWIPDNTTNITDPASRKTAGYVSTDSPPAGEHNYIFNVASQWENFIDRAFGTTYYVETTSGNDTTGDGTSGNPFKTIKHAVDLIENGGYGTVVLAETGDYVIDADINLVRKSILIYEDTAINANIIHENYVSSGNKYYSFNMYMGSNLAIYADTITMEDVDTGESSGNDCAIASYSGNNNISIFTSPTAGHGLIFTSTDPASGKPAYIRNFVSTEYAPFTTVQSYGRIATGSKGYVFDSESLPCSLFGYAGIIDVPAYWLAGGVDKTHTLVTGIDSTLVTPTFTIAPSPPGKITLKMYRANSYDSSPPNELRGEQVDSQDINHSDSDADKLTDVKSFMSTCYPAIDTDDITISYTEIPATGFTSFTITLSGDSIDKVVLDNHVVAVMDYSGSTETKFMTYTRGVKEVTFTEKNINLITNITSLK